MKAGTRGCAHGNSQKKKKMDDKLNFIDAHSRGIVATSSVGAWLKRSNTAFNGSTLLQVIEPRESNRIWRIISELESGEPG
jgi:hypothetical protein